MAHFTIRTVQCPTNQRRDGVAGDRLADWRPPVQVYVDFPADRFGDVPLERFPLMHALNDAGVWAEANLLRVKCRDAWIRCGVPPQAAAKRSWDAIQRRYSSHLAETLPRWNRMFYNTGGDAA